MRVRVRPVMLRWCIMLWARLPNSILDPPSAPSQLDGFDMSVDGLVAIALKFQQRQVAHFRSGRLALLCDFWYAFSCAEVVF